jgi:methanogenic corrinoid protein MtbC1
VSNPVRSDSENDAVAGNLTIQQVSRKLGIPAPTIRSWERRYGVPVTSRSQGGHRRYSAEQLRTLHSMRDLVAGGLRAVDAATQVKSALSTSPEPLIESFLEAAHDLQPGAIIEILGTGRQALGLDRTLDQILFPALHQIGHLWETGNADVGHEHLATQATRDWLASVSQTGPSLLPHSPIVLCCGPREEHTLGLEALGALLRHRGWDCRLLGARTPVESLARAVRETDAAAVILVCHVNSGRQAAVDALSSAELRQLHIFYAGDAFSARRARRGVPGVYLGDNLTEAAQLITSALLS